MDYSGRMFLLPNGAKIDEDGLFEAAADYSESAFYFLDTLTGNVGRVEQEDSTKLEQVQAQKERYLKIRSVPAESQLSWLLEMLIEMDASAEVIEKTANSLNKNKTSEQNLKECERILEKDKDGWIHGWTQWQQDKIWEGLILWLASLPVGIEDKFEGCGDCELCDLMELGGHTLGDFFETKQYEEEKTKEKKNKRGKKKKQ